MRRTFLLVFLMFFILKPQLNYAETCKAIYFSPNTLKLATGSPGELGCLKN
ncbi:hypothetical protein [Thermodesulfatator atlanticus]